MNASPHPRPRIQGSRRHALAMSIGMFALLLAVLFVAFRVIPLTPPGEISNWNARKLLRSADSTVATARRLHDAAPLFASASGIYRQVARGREIKTAYRLKAGIALAGLAPKLPAQIADIHDTVQMLFDQLTAPRDRAQLQPQLDAVTKAWRAAPLQTANPVQTALPPPPSPPHSASRIVANIAGNAVSADEIMYAWQAMNGDSLPTSDTLRLFTFKYLNMSLLAGEAQRRGLENDPRTSFDIKLNRIGALGDALDRDLASKLPTPTDAQLRAYYARNVKSFAALGDFEKARPAVHAAYANEQLAAARAALLRELHQPAAMAGKKPSGAAAARTAKPPAAGETAP